MNTWMKNDTTGRYLIMEQAAGSDFEESMIRALREETILVPAAAYEEGKRCSSYNVTGLVPVSAWLTKHCLTAEEIKGIVLCWNEVIEILAVHLLEEENILWDWNYIYVNETDGRWVFLARSGQGEALCKEGRPWQLLTEKLLQAVDMEDREAVRLSVRLVQAAMGGGELYDLIRVLDEKPQPAVREQDPEKDIYRIPELHPEEQIEAGPDGDAWDRDRFSGFPGDELPGRESMSAGEKERGRRKKSRGAETPGYAGRAVRNVLVSQLIMAAALVAVYLMKGFGLVQRLLPLYIVLCILAAAFFIIDALPGRANRT